MSGKQLGFGDYEQTTAKKCTKRERFLTEMEAVVPWKALIELIEPHYPKTGSKGGRPPYPLETMLRIHLMQQWYDLSDPAMEDALIEVPTMRRFAGINLISDRIPDETTILSFRHLLEKHDLSKQIFEMVKAHLKSHGMAMKQGTIIDATLIAAPSSTKNKKGERDPEIHQTRKGKQWYFGMKVHIGVDKDNGLIHSIETTAANVHDLTPAAELLHGQENVVYADSGYQGIEKREEMKGKAIGFRVAMRPGKRRALPDTPEGRLDDLIETAKAHIRAKGEHPFRVIKRQFSFQKTRFRGMLKNACKVNVLAALANLFMPPPPDQRWVGGVMLRISETHPQPPPHHRASPPRDSGPGRAPSATAFAVSRALRLPDGGAAEAATWGALLPQTLRRELGGAPARCAVGPAACPHASG
jgi:IS5 family transposase